MKILITEVQVKPSDGKWYFVVSVWKSVAANIQSPMNHLTKLNVCVHMMCDKNNMNCNNCNKNDKSVNH